LGNGPGFSTNDASVSTGLRKMPLPIRKVWYTSKKTRV
jgi:hypothetical protein